MPWECKAPDCGTVVETDDAELCPACGYQKPAWTIELEQTRQLVIGRAKKLECRCGVGTATTRNSPLAHLAVAWQRTDSVGVLTKQAARELARANRLPAPRDTLCVRMFPTARLKRWELAVAIEFEKKGVHEQLFVFEPQLEALGPDGFFSALFVCVHGDGAVDFDFPRTHILDVTENTKLGHAPTLNVSGFKLKKGVDVTLGSQPWVARWEGAAQTNGPPARMVLDAPALPAGEPVSIEVEQVGVGLVARLQGSSAEGGVSVEFSDWFDRTLTPTTKVELGVDEDFPADTFVFRVTAGGQTIESDALPFSDRFHAVLVNAAGDPVADTEYLIETPWGQKRVRTASDGSIEVSPIRPGGVRRAVFRGRVLTAEIEE